MSNISITDKELSSILNKLNIKDVDELFEIVPKKFLSQLDDYDLFDVLSEQEIDILLSELSDKNSHSKNSLCFLGGGSYDHYIPKVVDTLSSRSEFYTAYTPYQPEVSQGTLQYLYEFQTMICNLSGMEISNASLYDCASSIAEACSMALNITRKNKILLSTMLHPNYVKVVNAYFSTRDIKIELIESNNGTISENDLQTKLDDNTSCIVVQSPNYYGLIEDVDKISSIKKDSLLIVVSDPISMSVLKSPGECNADVYVGEGQVLGNYMSFGGPYIGLFASKLKYARKMPGRIIGRTTDVDDKEGFVMTLQTREQHIRRDKATSNICTNQGLLALRCTIYMSLLGEKGLPGIAKICYDNAHYALDQISTIDGFDLYYNDTNFIKEFVIKCKKSARDIQKLALKQNILIDLPINDTTDSLILLAFTEKRTKLEIDKLVDFFTTI